MPNKDALVHASLPKLDPSLVLAFLPKLDLVVVLVFGDYVGISLVFGLNWLLQLDIFLVTILAYTIVR